MDKDSIMVKYESESSDSSSVKLSAVVYLYEEAKLGFSESDYESSASR